VEHSLLHALQLLGTVVGLGGSTLMVAFVFPALRAKHLDQSAPRFAGQLNTSVAQWIFRGALVAAFAVIFGFFVDAAELDGRTVFGGVNPGLVWRFATMTTVGQLSLLRLAALVFTAAATRLPGNRKWGLVLVSSLAAVACEGLVCHAAAQPSGRTSAIAVELVHILAVSLWLGVLMHLLLARRAIESATDNGSMALVTEIVRRFSPIALAGACLLATSGLFLAVRYLCSPGAVFTSAYGLTLLVKMGLLVPLLYAGFVNYRRNRPGLEAAQTAGSEELRRGWLGRFGKTLELEATAGVLVIVVAGILASVSPPQKLETLRLTAAQLNAFKSPHLPRTVIPNPETFYGAQERTKADMRYAEFTHNWSGVMVCLLGSCWFLQSLGGRLGRWAEKSWPWLLIPLPVFVAVAADPEEWVLGKVGFAQIIQDPQLLEHQFGALLAFAVVGLGWLDQRLPAQRRPLGYTLPVVMILGSLLLLGHAHSNFTTTQDLTNLINVQHAIFGAFGLFAGVFRWLSLRGLIPAAQARLVWPVLVIGLGLFMAFYYRETI
jgi:putative copper resistance protein D